MYVANDMNQMQKYILNILKEVVEKVGERVNKLAREHVDNDVYKKGNQTNYYAYGTMQPTYGLRELLTTDEVKINGNEVSTKIYHDSNKMISDPDNFVHGSNYWHMQDIRDILPEIVEYGLSGDFFGSNQWWQDPRPYMQNTIKELQQSGKLRQFFVEELRSKGFTVV